MNIQRPEKSEYNPYFQNYIDLVPEGKFEDLFEQNTINTLDFFRIVPGSKVDFSYSVGKWTIKQILMHIIDTERVFAYRALVCSRGDNTTILYDVNDDLYASNVILSTRTIPDLLDEFLIVRKNSNYIFQFLDESHSKFLGTGTTHHFSARALGFIMIGHINHHINVILNRYL